MSSTEMRETGQRMMDLVAKLEVPARTDEAVVGLLGAVAMALLAISADLAEILTAKRNEAVSPQAQKFLYTGVTIPETKS
jgi:hypothetical protein